MSMPLANLTVHEEFRLTGTLAPARIEALIDFGAQLEQVRGVRVLLEEARGCFPAEDFLSPIQEQLGALQKRLRGENREALGAIIEALADVAQCTFYAADHGRNEVASALAAIQ